MTAPSFTELPWEIRDVIFRYAVSEDRYNAHDIRDSSDYRIKRIPIGGSRGWQWEAHHASHAPIPEYLCLMLANRQLYNEIYHFLERPHQQSQLAQPATAKMALLLEYPKLFTTWTQIPQPPEATTTLHLLLRINHIFHPAYIASGSQNALLSAVSDTLKRYIYYGPHLARKTPLRERLHLETVRITVAALGPFADLKDEYGSVEPQVETLFVSFVAILKRFCRSGVPWGCIDAVEVRMDGRDWGRIPVTSNLWNEQEFMEFQQGGFNWDQGDTVVNQPDTMSW